MARETKIGLVIGVVIILLVGVIVSDHLAVVSQQRQPMLTELAPSVDIVPAPVEPRRGTPRVPLPVNRHEGAASLPVAEAMPARPSERLAPASRIARIEHPSARVAVGAIPLPSELEDPSSRGPELPVGPTGSGLPRVVEAASPVAAAPQPTPSYLLSRSERTVAARPVAAANVTTHTVQADESLWKIAAKHYGDGSRWEVLRKANPNVVKANGSVREGAVLVIPDLSSLEQDAASDGRQDEAPAPATVPPSRTAVADAGQTHTGQTIIVQEGDSLGLLAQKYLGTSRRADDLFNANRDKLSSPDRVVVGMELRLPAEEAAPASRLLPGGTRSEVAETRRGSMYVVRDGDTLQGIALRELGSSHEWERIYEANRGALVRPEALRIGQTLIVPSK